MTVNNAILYNAVLAGAVGAALTNRYISSFDDSTYAGMQVAAVTLAITVDSAVATGTYDSSDAALLQSIVQNVFANRYITSSKFQDYESVADAIVTIWGSARTQLQAGGGGAGDVPYTPKATADWPIGQPPTNVAGALDLLALPASEQHAAGSLGASQTISFNANVTPTKSGIFLVVGTICGVGSAGGTIAGAILLDGVSITQAITGTGNANEFALPLIAVVQIADLDTHTFQINAVINAGTLTSSAGLTRIAWVELGG